MKAQTKETIKIYWRHTKPHWVLFLVLILAIIGASVTGAFIPLYFKTFFDTLATSAGDMSAAKQILLGTLLSIAIAELIRWFFWRVSLFANTLFQTKVLADLSNTCFTYVHKHSFSYFNGNFVGSLVKRFNWFVRAYESLLDKINWNILPLIVNITAVLFVLVSRHWMLACLIGIWAIVFLLVNWIFVSYKLKYDLERSEAESKATALLADTVTNNGNVKLFNGYAREVASYKAATDIVRRLRRFTWHIDSIFDGVQGLLTIGLELGIFYFAINLFEAGTITIGDFVLIQSYIIIILNDIWSFGKIIRNVYIDLADAEEMTNVLTLPHEVKDIRSAEALQVKEGSITFKEVDFFYHNTRKIISNLNLAIAPHEKVAFVGPSGAGKSTIVKLIMRNYDLTGGKIMIDGQNIAHVTQESLWQAVSLVPQDPILFHRSLMENIRYGKPDATDDEVIAAAKLAHCDEFINEFPEKYQTFVGERGVKLSGGERQRVAIARAILRNAPILVLDEATSSLDSESEALIQDALNTLMKDKTVIVIAHRLSTIMKMDRIVVIDGGSIREAGTHHELLTKPTSLYSTLWKLQAGGFMADKPADTTTDELEQEELDGEV
jgi:ATP-binding cassette subfamily B protein